MRLTLFQLSTRKGIPSTVPDTKNGKKITRDTIALHCICRALAGKTKPSSLERKIVRESKKMVVSKRANRIRASGNVRSDDENDEDNKHHDSHVVDDDDNDDDGGPKPVGGLVKVSKEGSVQKKHFEAFEYEGFFFHLGDPVLVAPDEGRKKPSVEIIKDIFKTEDGELIITGRRLYRPEEAEKRGGGIWQTDDSRQLFYSHHIGEVCAESVMHTCVVHFLPPGREVPNRKLRPGFIVQKVYDFAKQSLRDFTDRDLKDALR